MNTSTRDDLIVQPRVESRVLQEGYGPGAWHGPDLKAALADVTPAVAFRRPADGRHNIAEIALHHAYCVRSVRSQLSGRAAEPFVMAGEDWFEVSGEHTLAWPEIRATVEAEQQRLTQLIDDIENGTQRSAVPNAERLGLVLGITCHAVYHAGQVQLIKRLRGD
ncbi:MAG TPA: DinB family protein [Vicinamibacterales bacterium]|nr:DinB family protein [Vicinamibacterales bacterium]